MKDDKIRIYEESQQIVRKSNDLIRKTRYNLTATEMKIVIYLISKIVATDTEIRKVNINIKDFCALINVQTNGREYEAIKQSVRNLRDKSYWLTMPNGDELLFSWIDFSYIQKKNGNIEITLSKSLEPFLLQLRGNYTSYPFREILSLSGKHSIRLYEYLRSFLFKGYVRISITELKKILNIETKYKDWRDLKKTVIDPSLREIRKKTFLDVNYDVIKKGKKIEEIEFSVNEAMGYQTSWLDED